jgi:hypothetical protein
MIFQEMVAGLPAGFKKYRHDLGDRNLSQHLSLRQPDAGLRVLVFKRYSLDK